MSALATAGSNRVAALSVAKLTVAVTPGIRLSDFSMRAAHAAQVMPSMPRSSRRSAPEAGSTMAAVSTAPNIYPHGVYVKPRSGHPSESNFARQQVLEHHPVADEAV